MSRTCLRDRAVRRHGPEGAELLRGGLARPAEIEISRTRKRSCSQGGEAFKQGICLMRRVRV